MSSRKGPGSMTGDDVRQIRLMLGLSTKGLAILLNMPEHGDRTIRRWESGEQPDIPGPVQTALTLLELSDEARDVIDIAKLQQLHPPGTPGPKPEETKRKRA